MVDTRQYNPGKVTGSFESAAGFNISLTQAKVAGDFFSAQKDVNRWERETDGFGNVTWIRNLNEGGDITILVPVGHAVNAQLQAAYDQDGESEAVIGTLKLTDANGTATLIASGARIKVDPPWTRGVNRGDNAWVFGASEIKVKHGELPTL